MVAKKSSPCIFLGEASSFLSLILCFTRYRAPITTLRLLTCMLKKLLAKIHFEKIVFSQFLRCILEAVKGFRKGQEKPNETRKLNSYILGINIFSTGI